MMPHRCRPHTLFYPSTYLFHCSLKIKADPATTGGVCCPAWLTPLLRVKPMAFIIEHERDLCLSLSLFSMSLSISISMCVCVAGRERVLSVLCPHDILYSFHIYIYIYICITSLLIYERATLPWYLATPPVSLLLG